MGVWHQHSVDEPADVIGVASPEYRAAVIKILFGSTGRFALASWLVSRDGPFRLSDYGDETGRRVVASGHLTSFTRIGMVQRLEDGCYRRAPSPLWLVYSMAVSILGDPIAAEDEQMRSDLLELADRFGEV